MRNKPPKVPVVHFMSAWQYATMTSCGQHAFERAQVSAETRGAQLSNILVTTTPSEVTCGSCVRTIEFKRKANVVIDQTKTVGEPTQTGSEDQPAKINWNEEARAIGQRVPASNTFGEHQPLIHAQVGNGNPMPLCTNNDEANWTEGYSTMDGGAVTCRYCLQDPLFIQRNNMFTEMMSPTLADGEREPIAIVHDREFEEDYGKPRFEHDCEACKFLGNVKGWDLYWCSQGGGPNMSTVIGRFSDSGPDYISGVGHARDNEMLALAVVRAFRAGLLNDTDMSWL